MQIVVNHLTRMKTDARICVAGIDPETLIHVRPVTDRHDPLTRALLAEEGGPLSVGAVIELDAGDPRPDPPETEDHRIAARDLRRVGALDSDAYLELLDRACAPEPAVAFGPALERTSWSYTVEPGQGDRSLAVIRAVRRPQLSIDDAFGRVTLKLRTDDLGERAFLSVTDARFFERDHVTVRADVVEDVRNRIALGVDVLLMLGLSRAFSRNNDVPRHWMQVNGLCLADRPIGATP